MLSFPTILAFLSILSFLCLLNIPGILSILRSLSKSVPKKPIANEGS